MARFRQNGSRQRRMLILNIQESDVFTGVLEQQHHSSRRGSLNRDTSVLDNLSLTSGSSPVYEGNYGTSLWFLMPTCLVFHFAPSCRSLLQMESHALHVSRRVCGTFNNSWSHSTICPVDRDHLRMTWSDCRTILTELSLYQSRLSSP